jgi:hypothetical protein
MGKLHRTPCLPKQPGNQHLRTQPKSASHAEQINKSVLSFKEKDHYTASSIIAIFLHLSGPTISFSQPKWVTQLAAQL